jgi:hypothetical protein
MTHRFISEALQTPILEGAVVVELIVFIVITFAIST